MRPLMFLVADKNMEYALRGFFERDAFHEAVRCAPFEFDIRPHKDIKVASGQNDPGLFTRANELLRPFRNQYRHTVVMIDAEWEGSPGSEVIRNRLEQHIEDAGWPRADGLGLVLEPEVDAWLWSDSPHSATALGWSSWKALRAALESRHWLDRGVNKPKQPKEAAEWALRQKRKPRSSAIYRAVASRVSVNRCEDAALHRLLETLRRWFPQEGTTQEGST